MLEDPSRRLRMSDVFADHDDRESIEDSGPLQLRPLLLGVSIRDDAEGDRLQLIQHIQYLGEQPPRCFVSGEELRHDPVGRSLGEFRTVKSVADTGPPLLAQRDLALHITREMSIDRAAPLRPEVNRRSLDLRPMVRVEIAEVGLLGAAVVEQGVVEVEEDGQLEIS